MVRIRLLVRVIPEGVYVKDPRSRNQSPEEKRLLKLVEEPQNVSIGILANEIKEVFQRINQEPLGNIKYLKDGEVDADLDPEMSIYDAFVDAGKAATSLFDQTATIKIIREVSGQHFAVREGSLVPDLNKPRFQPSRFPPVPHFSVTNTNLGKRSRDDAFRDEVPSGGVSNTSHAARRPRVGALKESEARETLVPSIERELQEPACYTSHHDQECHIVIPETQDSPLRNEPNARRGGSEILGDDEPKSESPEVDDSINSLPLAPRDGQDAEISETAQKIQNIAIPEASNLDRVRAWSGPETAQKQTSLSSSNYYSPSSGSLKSTPNRRASAQKSASSSVDDASNSSRVDPTPNSTIKGLNLAKQGTAENGPITPPSDASRPPHTKAVLQDADSTVPNGLGPASRTSSFSYKFRRQDHVHSAEPEIDDTQMSPRSRRSLKRPRRARQSEAAPKEVGAREISGLFRHLDDERPLIQERKRQRKETKWDFSEHVDGLSEAENEDVSGNEEQDKTVPRQAKVDIDSSESSDVEDNAGQRSKSQGLSDATNQDSNASTERPIMSASLNALRSSQPPQNHLSDQGLLLDTMVADDSDKENSNHTQAMYMVPPSLDLYEDVDSRTLRPLISHEKENAGIEHEKDNSKPSNDSVVAILNDVTDTHGSMAAQASAQTARRLGSEVTKQKSSSNLPVQASPKTSRSRKKKSRVEDETEQTVHGKAEHRPASQAATLNSSVNESANRVRSTSKHKTGKKELSATEPDEQLSQDLQASARADNNITTTAMKKRKGSSQKRDALATKTGGVAGIGSAVDSSSKSGRARSESSDGSSVVDQQPRSSSDLLKAHDQLNSSANTSASATTIPAKSIHQDKTKDGKLGLGFSQSPPRKNRALLEPIVGSDALGHIGQTETSKALPAITDDKSFLKKSRSFDKLKSSQSWKADTPSRATQSGKMAESKSQHTSAEVPRRKPDTLPPPKQVKVSGTVQSIASGSESGSESSSDGKSSSSAGEETSKTDKASLENGKLHLSVDTAMPSVEMGSDSSSTESDDDPISTKSATQTVSKSVSGPTIVPKGNNRYDVNGVPMIVPLGFTVDSYMAMRANLANQSAKQNPRTRVTSSGKSATPTLHQKVSSPTPVPAPSKVAQNPSVPKKDAKRSVNHTKARDSPKPSSMGTANNVAAKQVSNVSKTKGLPQPSPAVATKKELTTKATNVPKTQASAKAPVNTKNTPAPPTRTTTQPAATISAKPAPFNRSLLTQKPSTLSELRADRAMKAATSSSKPPSKTTQTLAKGKNFLGGNDFESESDSESESNSSDDNAVASKTTTALAKTPTTGRAIVDLSIRDATPSSAEEDDEEL